MTLDLMTDGLATTGPVMMALGLAAGLLTTVAGAGGGLMLVAALAALGSPVTALAATTPALLVGNVQRGFMFRRSVQWSVIRPYLVGAVPGSLIGGLLVVVMPDMVVRIGILALTALALTRRLGWVKIQPSGRALTAAGVGIGGLCGATGGAGVLQGPLLMACGLTGVAYVATGAVGSASMHIARMLAYGATGLFSAPVLWAAGVLAVAIMMGNLTGRWLRGALGPERCQRMEVGALLVCVGVAVLGLKAG